MPSAGKWTGPHWQLPLPGLYEPSLVCILGSSMASPPGIRGRFSCLIIDDDLAFATLAAQVVRDVGGDTILAGSLGAAKERVSGTTFDLILLDNHLPDGKGYAFFEHLSRRQPEAPIVMITGLPDLGEAVSLTRNGLFDYLTKPVSVDALSACVERARQRIAARPTLGPATELFGVSPAMREVAQQLRQAARHAGGTVLITGETGAGKDVAARALHQWAFPGGDAPFIAVNCAALPAEMFESELFGAERGAYTGADRRRPGLAAAAAGGTLFLDEIGEVPIALQAKLLRLVEAREFRPLGTTENRAFEGRFVAATNKDLAAESRAGRFREDLMYRLDVFSVGLPPLRQRREDIPGLAELLLTQLSKRYARAKPLLKAEDIAALGVHDFPGNVRELRNVLERSLLRTPEDSRWLSLDWVWLNRTHPVASAPSPAPAPSAAAPKPAETFPPPLDRDLTPVEAQEYRLIGETLRNNHGGIRRSAAALGLSPQALLRRLDKWPELRPPDAT